MTFDATWGYSRGVNDLIHPADRSTKLGETAIHFGDVMAACESFIRGSEQVVGAVAWVRSPRLVAALAERPTALIVNKEFALRKAMSKERAAIAPLKGGVRGFSMSKEPVRVLGDCSRGSFTGLMHHKFLVRLRKGRPVAVWTGSFNLTSGAAGNFENAIEIHDPAVAAEYLIEFARLWQIAEPLNFKSGSPAGQVRSSPPSAQHRKPKTVKRPAKGTAKTVPIASAKRPQPKRKAAPTRRAA